MVISTASLASVRCGGLPVAIRADSRVMGREACSQLLEETERRWPALQQCPLSESTWRAWELMRDDQLWENDGQITCAQVTS